MELSGCIVWIPEPLAAKQMLRAKLSQKPFGDQVEFVDVPEEVAVLCPDLIAPREAVPEEQQFETAIRCLEQLMLVRAHKGAVKP